MKLLIVGQTNFIIASLDAFVMEHYTPTNNLQADISFVLNSNADIIIIQAEQSANYLESPLFGGVELMVWFRIRGVKAHIVLASWSSLHAILNSTKYGFITGAKGSTFCQVPGFPASPELIELTKEPASDENLQLYFSAMFDKLKFRHREANWWGVKSLWDVHNVIYNLKDSYPPAIDKYLKTLNNELAKSLFGYDEESINNGLIGLLHHKRSNIVLSIESEIVKLLDKKTQVETLKKYFSSGRYKDEKAVFFKEAEIKLIENQFAQLNTEKILAEKSDADIKVQLELWTNEIKTGNSKLLYIDDNATNGWDEILRKMMPGVPIDSIVPDTKYKDNIAGLYGDVIKPKLSPNNYTLIILDLRLFDETDINIAPGKLSGSQLLQEIRKDFAHLPILIITASNKRFSYSALINVGADAYWTKEGIDEHKTAIDSVRNYELLVSFVKKLHSKEFVYLGKLVNILDRCNEYSWWCNHTWINGDKTEVDFSLLKKLLKQIIDLYKAYLHRFYIETESSEEEAIFFLTGLINKFGLVVEAIHELKTKEDFEKASPLISYKRKDSIGKKIRDLRNDSSHLLSMLASKNLFFEVIDLVDRYLTEPNKYTELLISNFGIKKSDFGKEVLVDSKYTILLPDNNLEFSKVIAESQKFNQFRIKINSENEGILIVIDSNLSVGERKVFNPANGVLIGDYFIMSGDIYKINSPIKNRLAENPNEEINCKYNNGSGCWELPT